MTWFGNSQVSREWSFLKTLSDIENSGQILTQSENYSDVYMEWMKRFIQEYVKFEEVFKHV